MRIKTASEILDDVWYKDTAKETNWREVGVKAMKEYAAQFIDLAASNVEEELNKYLPMVTKKSILNIKELIK